MSMVGRNNIGSFILIIVCFMFVKGTDKNPLIDIREQIINRKSIRIIYLECTTTFQPLGCSVVFLLNNKSVDNLRLKNNTCYHKEGKCHPRICTCYNDCRTFRFNYTDNENLKTFNFGCTARKEDEKQNTPKIEVNKFYNGTESYYYEEENKIDGNEISTNNKEEDKEEKDKSTVKTVADPPFTCSSTWKVVALSEVAILVVTYTFAILGICYLRKKPKENIPRQRQKTIERNEEEIPLIDNDIDDQNECSSCGSHTVCAVCVKCKKTNMLCGTCCTTHNEKFGSSHTICQVEHCLAIGEQVSCTLCKKIAERFCTEEKSFFCNGCSKMPSKIENHKHKFIKLIPAQNKVHTKIVKTDYRAEFKYKIITKTSQDSPSRLCGVCFMNACTIIVADFGFKSIMVFNQINCIYKFDLAKEPKGMAKVTDSTFAVTFPHEKQLIIYNFDSNSKTITLNKTIPIKGKPYSIAHSQQHFAIEVDEGDDGKIEVINYEGTCLHVIKKYDIAHFTGNTLRLACDFETRKVFVVAVSKNDVLCVDFSGNILWRKSLASPRGIVFVENALTYKNVIVASKQWNLIYQINSENGFSDIIMGEGQIDGPRYIDYYAEEKLLCMYIQNGDVLIYKYDINGLD